MYKKTDKWYNSIIEKFLKDSNSVCLDEILFKDFYAKTLNDVRFYFRWNVITTPECIISWLTVLYALNGRKVTVWILYRYEMAKI